MPFVTYADLPPKSILPGINGRYAHTEKITFGDVEVAAGTVLPMHQHPHDQISYVLTGEVDFTVDGETRRLAAGDCAVIPGGLAHGCRALTHCRIIDVFSPSRDDYRPTHP